MTDVMTRAFDPALATAQTLVQTGAPPTAAPSPTIWDTLGRHATLISIIVVLLVGLLMILVYRLMQRHKSPPPPMPIEGGGQLLPDPSPRVNVPTVPPPVAPPAVKGPGTTRTLAPPPPPPKTQPLRVVELEVVSEEEEEKEAGKVVDLTQYDAVVRQRMEREAHLVRAQELRDHQEAAQRKHRAEVQAKKEAARKAAIERGGVRFADASVTFTDTLPPSGTTVAEGVREEVEMSREEGTPPPSPHKDVQGDAGQGDAADTVQSESALDRELDRVLEEGLGALDAEPLDDRVLEEGGLSTTPFESALDELQHIVDEASETGDDNDVKGGGGEGSGAGSGDEEDRSEHIGALVQNTGSPPTVAQSAPAVDMLQLSDEEGEPVVSDGERGEDSSDEEGDVEITFQPAVARTPPRAEAVPQATPVRRSARARRATVRYGRDD